MLSLRLWKALRTPPTNASLFRRAYSTTEEPFPWYIGCGQWAAGLLIFPVIAFAGTIYSLGWAAGIANLIGRERARHTYDLICVAPPGPLGVSWAMALGYLYRHRTFRNVNQPGNLIARVALTSFVLAGLGAFSPNFGLLSTDTVIAQLLARVITLALAVTIEHVQSVALGVEAGLMAATSTEDGNNAQIIALALYAGVQLTTYLGTVVIGFMLLPSLLGALNANGLFAYALLMIVRVTVLAALREGLLVVLWHVLTARVNGMATDLTPAARRPSSATS